MKRMNDLVSEKEFLSQLANITAEERKAIEEWRKAFVDSEFGKSEREFLMEVDKALAEVKYDFYMVMIFKNDSKNHYANKGKEIIPDYTFTEANKNEETLWLAHAGACYGWDFEEVCNYDIYRATEALYVFKK